MAVDRGLSPAVLAGACVVVLVVMVVVVRRAGTQAAQPPVPVARKKSRLRTLAVLIGLGLLEVTQIPSASGVLKTASVVAAIALFIWAIIASRLK